MTTTFMWICGITLWTLIGIITFNAIKEDKENERRTKEMEEV